MRVWLAVLLAACGSADGVIVEVDPSALGGAALGSSSSIELVLADRVCQDPLRGDECASIQAPPFEGELGDKGDLYTREASATVRGIEGVTRFELTAGDHRLPMAFAIARDPQGQIIGTAVMADTIDLSAGPIVYRVALEPTGPLLDRDPPAGRALATQWGADNQCLGVLPKTSTLDPVRPVFILPGDDPDCDTRITAADGECDALWFDGFTFDPNMPAQCAQPSTTITGAPCMLGEAPVCIERGAPVACVESNRCAPDAVCTCDVTDVACQNEKLASPSLDARLDCTFPAQLDPGNQISIECSAQDSFFVDPGVIFDLGGATCSKAKLVQTPDAALTSDLGDQFARGGAVFEVVDTQPDCTIHLRWTGTFAGPRAHTVLVVLIDVAGEARELWVPINFEPSLACPIGDQPTCTYVDSIPVDRLARCTR